MVVGSAFLLNEKRTPVGQEHKWFLGNVFHVAKRTESEVLCVRGGDQANRKLEEGLFAKPLAPPWGPPSCLMYIWEWLKALCFGLASWLLPFSQMHHVYEKCWFLVLIFIKTYYNVELVKDPISMDGPQAMSLLSLHNLFTASPKCHLPVSLRHLASSPQTTRSYLKGGCLPKILATGCMYSFTFSCDLSHKVGNRRDLEELSVPCVG